MSLSVPVFLAHEPNSLQKNLYGILTVATVIDHDIVEVASIGPPERLPHVTTGDKPMLPALAAPVYRRLLVNRRLSTALTAIFAMGLATPALSAEICGIEATPGNGAMMVQAGKFSAHCIDKGKCSITLSSVDNVGIALERASVSGSWLTLVTSTFSIDSGAGIDLVFDGEDETRIAPDFLIAAEDMKSVRVDDDVSDIVLSTMLQSKTMNATVQLIGGKRIVHEIALGDLATATKWVDCAQAK